MGSLGPKGIFGINTMNPIARVLIPVDPPTAACHVLTPAAAQLQATLLDLSHLRSTAYPMGIFLLLSHPDVNSWLLTFGFQLHNVIPGYPKPDTDAMEPSYELMHTQMKTQEWDNSKVIRAHFRSEPY